MPRILEPNPDAKPIGDFPVVRPGTYRMRIDPDASKQKEEISKNSNPMVLFLAQFAQSYPELQDENGQPLTSPPGQIFHRLVTAREKQGMLCALVTGCGIPWGEFIATHGSNTDVLAGLEFEAKIGVEEYEGTKKNVIQRVIVPKELA